MDGRKLCATVNPELESGVKGVLLSRHEESNDCLSVPADLRRGPGGSADVPQFKGGGNNGRDNQCDRQQG